RSRLRDAGGSSAAVFKSLGRIRTSHAVAGYSVVALDTDLEPQRSCLLQRNSRLMAFSLTTSPGGLRRNLGYAEPAGQAVQLPHFFDAALDKPQRHFESLRPT